MALKEGQDWWKCEMAALPLPEGISLADRLRLMSAAAAKLEDKGEIISISDDLRLLRPASSLATAQAVGCGTCPETLTLHGVLSADEAARVRDMLEATGAFGPGRGVASGPASVRQVCALSSQRAQAPPLEGTAALTPCACPA